MWSPDDLAELEFGGEDEAGPVWTKTGSASLTDGTQTISYAENGRETTRGLDGTVVGWMAAFQAAGSRAERYSALNRAGSFSHRLEVVASSGPPAKTGSVQATPHGIVQQLADSQLSLKDDPITSGTFRWTPDPGHHERARRRAGVQVSVIAHWMVAGRVLGLALARPGSRSGSSRSAGSCCSCPLWCLLQGPC